MDNEIRVTQEERSTHHELLLDGKSVSGLWLLDLRMRIGESFVRMGGIAGVGTSEEHRNRGYSRRVLEHSTRWMEENEFDCAILFGIDDFYHKFGYGVCLPDCRFEVRTRDAERATGVLTARPFTAADVPAVSRIYEAACCDLTGCLQR